MLGAGNFSAPYGGLADGVLQRKLFEGNATLAETGQAHALVPGIPGWIMALVVGAVFLASAFWLP